MADYKAGNLSVEFFGIDKTLSGTLNDITNRLEKLEKVTSNLGKTGKESNKNSVLSKFNLAYAYGRIRVITNAMIRMGRVAAKILQYGVDYTETLNLWQVAMGNNLSMAQEFVTQMNKAYGISEKTLMNAQAIFKNMIGSLGQISDTMAYSLSEAITKMAIDYASLYNVSIDAAITKFQAALAGQVRPIRSVSGYDITENTLYQLYQSIGGTKTMRQLSRTEKQLLSIYAIFKQMGASGALGDMDKTIDQVANQSRMMSENWEQVATWAGVSFQYILQEYNVFKYINAILIFTAELLKAIAYELGYKTPDFANSWADNVEDTEKAVEELQGKLLDFDKFRSLSGAEENALGIDTKLLEALSGYTSDIGNATNEARKLAEQWMEASFWTKNANGELEFSNEKFKEFKQTIVSIGTLLLTIFSVKLGSNIIKFLSNPINIALTAVVFLINSFIKLINAMSEGESVLRAFVGVLTIVATTIAAIAVATHAWKYGPAKAIAAAALVGGAMLSVGTLFVNSIPKYANGGMPDKGTMFIAGEAGAEMVYNTPSGQSGVANIEQIQQAMFGAMVAYGRMQGGSNDQPIVVQIDGEKVFQATKKNAKRHGLVFSKV